MNKKIRRLNDNAQILTLLSFLLITSVMIISSLAAEIANIDLVVTSDIDSSLQTEFTSIKETFGKSLNYNLTDIEVIDPDSRLNGNIDALEDSFENVKFFYYQLALNRSYLFDANINLCWYGYEENVRSKWYDIIYYVDVTLMLNDGASCISEDLVYSIILTKSN